MPAPAVKRSKSASEISSAARWIASFKALNLTSEFLPFGVIQDLTENVMGHL